MDKTVGLILSILCLYIILIKDLGMEPCSKPNSKPKPYSQNNTKLFFSFRYQNSSFLSCMVFKESSYFLV